jgi:hypothetical protein
MRRLTPLDQVLSQGGWMAPTLPYRLKVSGRDEFEGLGVTSTSYRVHGFLRVDGRGLVVEWGGTAHVQEIGMSLREETEQLPTERIEVPFSDLFRAELTGGWFRPRLRVQARTVGALSRVPSEKFGAVEFWYDRSERFAAIEVFQALRAGIEATERSAPDRSG